MMRGDHEPTHTLLMQPSRASGWSLRLFQDILLVDANICKLHLSSTPTTAVSVDVLMPILNFLLTQYDAFKY